MTLHKGDVVKGYHGSYTVESLIGYGGLGAVWKGRTPDGRFVAIKEPLTGTPQDNVNVEKLQIEAFVLERLTGPKPLYKVDSNVRNHIVRYWDKEGDPPRKLVLDFVEGISMEKKYRSGTGQQLNPTDVDEYAIRILKTVASLHENNILHRDISPHNLICSPRVEMDPVLVDFGTAKEGYNQLSASVLSSQIIKAGYSAPELALGLASPTSDLYSVAATILFLYTGTNPQYLMTSKFELDERHKLAQRIPEERKQMIKRAMAYHPADRIQTADDMLNTIAGRQITISRPHVVASGRKYEITGSMVIGKQHTCGDDCRRRGFGRPPDIGIYDPGGYVSRHHCRIQIGSDDTCWVEDLHAMNHTAVRRATGHAFEILPPGKIHRLQDGDIMALAYSPTKGAYMTVSFHAR